MKQLFLSLSGILISSVLYGQVKPDSLYLQTQLSEDSGNIRVHDLDLNTRWAEYAPVVKGRNLYFVSSRPANIGVQFVDQKENSEITDLYRCVMTDSLRCAVPRRMPAPLNTKFYEGPFTLSPDEQTMYLSSNDKRSGLLAIYVSRCYNRKWSKPEKLGFCRDSFSYCHPALSASGTRLFFSSDQRGGAGGMDLYYADLVNGSWSGPVSLGPAVNTAANELFPFAQEAALYFSRETPGNGLDIFRFANNALDEPYALPPPINSKSDDFGIWVDSAGSSGYFSSNRRQEEQDNIFYFSRKYPDFSMASMPPAKTSFCYAFYEETSSGNNDTVNLQYEWSFGDGGKARGLRARHCYQTYGTYQVKLNVVEKSSGEIFSSVVEYDLEIARPATLDFTCKDTAAVAESMIFDARSSALKGYEIRQMFWSFGDEHYNTGPLVAHRYRRPGTYTAELWVIAHNIRSATIEKFRILKQIVVKD